MKQFFVKIDPNLDLVNCGKIEVLQRSTKLHYHRKDGCTDFFNAHHAIFWLNSEIKRIQTKKEKVLFYIHGFWASLSIPFHRTSSVFEHKYFRDKNDNIAAVVHIVWNASTVYYHNSVSNLLNSKGVLADIFKSIEEGLEFKRSLMCHSMGNRFLFETIKGHEVYGHFEELLMLAPDLHTSDFQQFHSLFTNLSENIYVFYHKKDKTLKLSHLINQVSRLGRVALEIEDTNFSFIEMSHLSDISSTIDKMMRHNYFIYSDTAQKKIEHILGKK